MATADSANEVPCSESMKTSSPVTEKIEVEFAKTENKDSEMSQEMETEEIIPPSNQT
jgi:hypothetical protein